MPSLEQATQPIDRTQYEEVPVQQPAPAPIVPSNPPAPNPYLRSPLPSLLTLQPDSLRQFYNSPVPQKRAMPLMAAANTGAGAQAQSQAIVVNDQVTSAQNMDTIPVGSTYGKPLLSYVPSGIPYTFQGAWSGVLTYNKGDLVSYSGNTWLAVASSTGSAPSTSNSKWQILGPVSFANVGAGTNPNALLISGTLGPTGGGVLTANAYSGLLPVANGGTGANSVSANQVFAGPASGAAAAPSFRGVVPADVPVFVASGASHASGAVPDPGSVAGTTKFLREDATWAVPSSGGSTPWSALAPATVVPPVLANFTNVHVVTGTSATQNTNSVSVVFGSTFPGGSYPTWLKALPAIPYTALMGFVLGGAQGTYAFMGIAVRDSATDRHIFFRPRGESAFPADLRIDYYTSAAGGGFSSAPYATNWIFTNTPIIWLAVHDDGTNFTFYSYMPDGVTAVQVAQISRTAWLANPNQIGFVMGNETSANLQAGVIVHWSD